MPANDGRHHATTQCARRGTLRVTAAIITLTPGGGWQPVPMMVAWRRLRGR